MALIFSNFKSYSAAKNAVSALIKDGFPPESINAIVQQSAVKKRSDNTSGKISDIKEKDTVGNALLDTMVKKVRPVRFPETGEVFAAGPLAQELAISVPVTTGGSLNTALKAFLPSNAANNYLDTVCSGGVLVWVNTETKVADAEQVFINEHGKQITTLE